MITQVLNDTAVDTLIDSAMTQDLNSSYATWTHAAKQANSIIHFYGLQQLITLTL